MNEADIEIAELEKEYFESPEFHIYQAIERLDEANTLLWNKGIQEPRDLVLKALNNAKNALKRIEQ